METNIITKLGMQCVFIRYNPDDKKGDYNVLLERNKNIDLKDIKGIEQFIMRILE